MVLFKKIVEKNSINKFKHGTRNFLGIIKTPQYFKTERNELSNFKEFTHVAI